MISATHGAVALLPLLFFIPVLLVALAGVAFWIWMMIDCATKESSQGNDKVVWILVIIFAQVIGALIYFLVRRPQRKAQLGA